MWSSSEAPTKVHPMRRLSGDIDGVIAEILKTEMLKLHSRDAEAAGEFFHFGGGLLLAHGDRFLHALEDEAFKELGVEGIDHRRVDLEFRKAHGGGVRGCCLVVGVVAAFQAFESFVEFQLH